jgi:outer membrane receptor protein involved in Fe transport
MNRNRLFAAPAKAALLSSAASLAVIAVASAANAQESAPPADEATEEIVVTGVVRATNRIDTSISVSAIDADKIAEVAPLGTSEVFRYLPGVRSESSAGGGNSNIGVRGLPIFTGGAQFVSLQEDGLPVLLFGDHNFAPVDTFTKINSSLARVESVRGGSATVLTTNGNGAIINLISKTGKDDGGSIMLRKGLDHSDTRVDAEFGGRIANDMYFHVGGHFQSGGDYRNLGFDGVEGGKIRASFTKEFADRGFARVYAQFTDIKDATYMPQPIGVVGAAGSATAGLGAATTSGRTLGRLASNDGAIPGLRPQDQSLHSPQLVGLPTVDSDGVLRTTDLRDGIRTQSTIFGGEFEFDLGAGVTVNNKFRYADIEGVFLAPFTHNVTDADRLRTTTFGGAAMTIANGPFRGQAATSANLRTLTGNSLVSEVALFDTEFKDMGNIVNDLRFSKSFDTGGGASLDLAAGYFKMAQKFQQDWHWGRFLVTTEDNASLIDVAGFTENGIYTYNGAFGRCCNIRWDLKATVDAPYALATFKTGAVTIDGGARYEHMNYDGFAIFGSGRNVDVNRDGVIGPAEIGVPILDPATRGIIDDSLNGVSYSFGVNYAVRDNLALFGRYSKGVTWNFDRQFGAFNGSTDGSINNKELLRDKTKQWEIGVKWNEDGALPGDLDFYLTFFNATAVLNNNEITTGLVVDATFKSKGVELEWGYELGGFNLAGNVTWTDAHIDKSGVAFQIGNTPRRQADWIYNISPSYRFGKFATVGANINGTSASFADFNNNIVQPGYTVVGAFVNVGLFENATLSLNANNLFDTVGITEAEVDAGRVWDTNGDGAFDVTSGRSITGRTISLTLSYRF